MTVTRSDVKVHEDLEALADHVARKQFRQRFTFEQAHAAGFGFDDLAQELMLYAYDPEAQRRKGLKIHEGMSDDQIRRNFRHVANDWLNELGHRSAIGPLAVASTDVDRERSARDAARKRIEAIEQYAADEDELAADVAIAEADLEKALRAANGRAQPSEAHRWIDRTFGREPGEPWYAAQRRMLGRALLDMWQDDGQADYVRALVHKFGRGRSLNSAERKQLSRAVEACGLRINRNMHVRREGHEGPGGRRAIRNTTALALTGRQREHSADTAA